MGDEPTQEPELWKEILPILAKFCATILEDGMKDADRQILLKKYLPPKNLPTVKAPEINPEVEAMLKKDHQAALKRDGYQQTSQAQLGACIAALGFSLSPMTENPPDEEKNTRLSCMADCARLMSDLNHNMSMTRRSFITPQMDLLTKSVADKGPIDSYLYGESFGDSVTAARALIKAGNDHARKPSTTNLKTVNVSDKACKQNLNSKRPPHRQSRNRSDRSGRRHQSPRRNNKRRHNH